MTCPYELCWYNESLARKGGETFDIVGGKYNKDIFLKFKPSPDYEGSDPYTVDIQKIKEAQQVPAKAMEIVREYEGCTDREKLEGYHTELSERANVGYQYINGKTTTNGDNYQLIPIFNYEKGKAEICCSGFSKAFQYLCSLSRFENAHCYMVAGSPGRDEEHMLGAHMWNVFNIDGCNHMTDVTWSISVSKIFMPECIEHSPKQCRIIAANGSQYIYRYEKDTLELYGDKLEIGGQAPSASERISAEVPQMPQIKVTTNEDDSKTIELFSSENAEIYYSVMEPDPELLNDDTQIERKLYDEPFVIDKVGGYYVTAAAKTVSEDGKEIWSKTNSIAVWVTDNLCGDNLKWEIDFISGTLYISGTGEMWNFSIQKAPWYPYIKNIRRVVCEFGVMTIGAYAFWWCTSLKEVSLPSSVNKICRCAFDTCSALEKIELPNQVTVIGDKAFINCKELKTVTFGRWIERIEQNAFLNCTPEKVLYRGKTEAWEKVDIADEGNDTIKELKNREMPVTDV